MPPKGRKSALQKALEKASAITGVDLISQLSGNAEDSRQAEAVLKAWEKPDRFGQARDCKWCESFFVTDLACVSYCSDACRKSALQEIGIQWDPSKSPEERWGQSGIPLIIPPAVVDLLASYLQKQAEPILVDALSL